MLSSDVNAILLCPRAVNGIAPKELDLTLVLKAEARMFEVAIATPEKSLELMATFNEAMSKLSAFMADVQHEKDSAARLSKQIKARVMLDQSGDYLKERKLGNSADLRMAVVEVNEEYQRSVDIVDQLRAVLALLDGKMSSLKMAYFGCKDVIKVQALTVGTHQIHSTFDREERLELESSSDENEETFNMEVG